MQKILISLEVIIAVQVTSAVQVYLEGNLGISLSRATFHLLSLPLVSILFSLFEVHIHSSQEGSRPKIPREILTITWDVLGNQGLAFFCSLPVHDFWSSSSRKPKLQVQTGPELVWWHTWEQPPLLVSQLFTISISIPGKRQPG